MLCSVENGYTESTWSLSTLNQPSLADLLPSFLCNDSNPHYSRPEVFLTSERSQVLSEPSQIFLNSFTELKITSTGDNERNCISIALVYIKLILKNEELWKAKIELLDSFTFSFYKVKTQEFI